jgi:hypothetical protein
VSRQGGTWVTWPAAPLHRLTLQSHSCQSRARIPPSLLLPACSRACRTSTTQTHPLLIASSNGSSGLTPRMALMATALMQPACPRR